MIKPANLEWLPSAVLATSSGHPKVELESPSGKLKSWVIGRQSDRGWMSGGSAAAPRGKTPSCCAAVPIARPRNEPCVSDSRTGSSRDQKMAASGEQRRYKVGVVGAPRGATVAKNSRAGAVVHGPGRSPPGWWQHDHLVGSGRRPWTGRQPVRGAMSCGPTSPSGAAEIWRAYMQLTDAEAAFQSEADLKLRPVWHERGDRVEAHILVCFLAYVLRKTLEGWSERAGLGHESGETARGVARIQSTDVVLPTKDDRVVRLRCVVQPDKARKILLDHLGLTLPHRLRMPKGMALHVVPTLGVRLWRTRENQGLLVKCCGSWVNYGASRMGPDRPECSSVVPPTGSVAIPPVS